MYRLFGVVPVLLLLLSTSFKSYGDALDHWTWRNPQPQANDLPAACYGNGAFLLAGGDAALVTSTDATNWFNASVTSTNRFFGATTGNGLFVAVGVNGTIVTSSDGLSWSTRNSGTTN